MRHLEPFQGENPSYPQLIATYGIGFMAATLTLNYLGLGWESAILAFIVFDWVGGVVANAAEPVRKWWRTRPHLKAKFFIVHVLEIPLVYLLTGGEILFYILLIVLAAKLSIFEIGQRM